MSPSHIIFRRDIAKRPRILEAWEQYRNRPGMHYVMELVGEAVGVKCCSYLCPWFKHIPDGCFLLHVRR